MAMSAGDSPRDLQDLGGGLPSVQRGGVGRRREFGGIIGQFAGDTLSDCFFSLRKKSPKSPRVYSGPEACVSSHNIQQDSSDTDTDSHTFLTQAPTITENCTLYKTSPEKEHKILCICSSDSPTSCTSVYMYSLFLYIFLLYMFRVIFAPILRSTNCRVQP
jgi:hypothetical protein